ncbi:MAG: leucine-rich repeat domain-containing protein [Crocinitomicaceae bacterium]|nr:leucine-rich repeat domain-containing protein [Crocinitomicaceae bacterium]MBK8927170.1 leucine-rich repeat domain-containing protein [Crocinitomicaceae bacterium]
MKSTVAIFLISLLFFNAELIAQKNHVFYSIEEAITVPVDSVFKLSLTKMKYEVVPDELMQFQNLRELDLSQNKLTTLPDNFIFPHLEILKIEKNNLDTFPPAICLNTQLRELYMGRNEVKYISECIGNLQELVKFDIWFNPIADLPQAFTTMKKLRYLDLRGITYNKEFQKKWTTLLPWVKIEFDVACDCAN